MDVDCTVLTPNPDDCDAVPPLVLLDVLLAVVSCAHADDAGINSPRSARLEQERGRDDYRRAPSGKGSSRECDEGCGGAV
jgi:hypothetical protein